MNRRTSGVIFSLLLILPASCLGANFVAKETWYETRTEKGKLGFLHWHSRPMERDGARLMRTRLREKFSYLRSGDRYEESQEYETLEDEDGRVLELRYTTNLSKEQRLSVRGKVAGRVLTLRVFKDGEATPFMQTVPWDSEAIGLWAADQFFKGKKLRTGDVHIIKQFHLSANRVVPVSYTIRDWGTTRVGKKHERLLRVDQSYPKELYITPSTIWLDENGATVKIVEQTPLFGDIRYERSAARIASAPFVSKVADADAPVRVNKPIRLWPRGPSELLVRITVEDDHRPATLFCQDDRQRLVRADEKHTVLRLLASPIGDKAPSLTAKPGRDYLDSNFFIRTHDAHVRKLAKKAVGLETNPRRQIEDIRRWLTKSFRGNYSVPFATADEVARTLEGDCSEMGVLAAAMCRSLGIPSRVAFGLVYDSANSGFGGHLWTEVYVDGRWETFDPTGIVERLRAAYIKIADYSLKDVLNPDVLVEVRRAFAGHMKIEVLETH